MDFLKRMLLLGCMGFLLLAGSCSGDVDVTNGDGGAGATWCNGKLCAEFASCVNQICVCDQEPNNHGHGYSGCHTIHDVSAFIKNDPIITTFSNDKGNVPVPCRYSFTSFTAFFPKDGNAGYCQIKINAFNRKSKGKFYLYGFDVGIVINYVGVDTVRTTRMRGVAENGIYTFLSNTTADLWAIDGPYGNDDCNFTHENTDLVKAVCKIDPVNNVASIDLDGCGIGIKFRPYDTALGRNQPMVPGLSVVISRNHTPNFIPNFTNLALAPTFDPNYVILANRLQPKNGSTTAKMVHKVLEFHIEQNVDDNDKCNSLDAVVGSCSDASLQMTYERCLWTIETPTFIRCFDNSTNGKEIMGLFGDCALTVCGTGNLTQVIQQVASSLCAPTNPHVAKFVALG